MKNCEEEKKLLVDNILITKKKNSWCKQILLDESNFIKIFFTLYLDIKHGLWLINIFFI